MHTTSLYPHNFLRNTSWSHPEIRLHPVRLTLDSTVSCGQRLQETLCSLSGAFRREGLTEGNPDDDDLTFDSQGAASEFCLGKPGPVASGFFLWVTAVHSARGLSPLLVPHELARISSAATESIGTSGEHR